MISGKLSAIRWMLGDEWDMPDSQACCLAREQPGKRVKRAAGTQQRVAAQTRGSAHSKRPASRGPLLKLKGLGPRYLNLFASQASRSTDRAETTRNRA